VRAWAWPDPEEDWDFSGLRAQAEALTQARRPDLWAKRDQPL
jgi:hypothetical protein